MGNEETPPRDLTPEYDPHENYNSIDKKSKPDNVSGKKLNVCTEAGCNKAFSRPSRLWTHLLSHTGARPFACDKPGCDKSFTRAAHLKRHEIVNHSGASTPQQAGVNCSYENCESTFANKYSLEKHVKRFHETKQYNCDKCDKSFHKHHLLRNHQREHSGGNPLECSVCDKSFQWPFELKRHERSHKIKRCDLCEDVFEKWSDLTLHKSFAHVGKQEAPVNCDVCNKEFKLMCHLQQHKKIHSETREVFHCSVEHCPRFYYFLYNLEHHVRSYHQGNNFPCNLCPKKLVSKQKLKEHEEIVHGNCSPKKKKRPPSGINRKRRKDQGQFKKPTPKSGHKAMASMLTGIDIATTKKNALIEDNEVPLNDPKEIAAEMKEFVGDTLGLETSDSEPVIGCKRRTGLGRDTFKDVDSTLMGVIKRLEQDKHFKKLKLPESEIDSDTDLDNELEAEGDLKSASIEKKTFNFSNYLRK